MRQNIVTTSEGDNNWLLNRGDRDCSLVLFIMRDRDGDIKHVVERDM